MTDTSDTSESDAPITEPAPDLSPDELEQAPEVEPEAAPVSSPKLTPEKRAGVNLTWGVLGIITLFLTSVLVILWRTEASSRQRVDEVLTAALAADTVQLVVSGGDTVAVVSRDTTEMQAVVATLSSIQEVQQASRQFWLDLLQIVLLNVLLPVLTALLGYVFGTQSVAASSAEQANA